jgi:hypothetical protein
LQVDYRMLDAEAKLQAVCYGAIAFPF